MDLSPERLKQILFSKRAIQTIILANLAGTAFGFYYYRFILEANPVNLWPFIPDSPLATLFMATSLTLYLCDRQNSLVDALAFISNLKYGVWTVFVYFNMFSGFIEFTTPSMFVFYVLSHVLMAAQAFMVLEYSEISLKPILGVFTWFLVNDWLDYTRGIHAELPREIGLVSTTSMVAFTLTLTSTALLLWLTKNVSREKFYSGLEKFRS